MGISLIPIPVDSKVASWLADEQVACPKVGSPSRWPTADELRAILGSLDGCRVEYTSGTDGWDASVYDLSDREEWPAVVLWVKQPGSDEAPVDFHFYKPHDCVLALRIAQRVARLCGPLMVVEPGHMLPVVVTADSDTVAQAKALFGPGRSTRGSP
jgi:hypothetical protein